MTTMLLLVSSDRVREIASRRNGITIQPVPRDAGPSFDEARKGLLNEVFCEVGITDARLHHAPDQGHEFDDVGMEFVGVSRLLRRRMLALHGFPFSTAEKTARPRTGADIRRHLPPDAGAKRDRVTPPGPEKSRNSCVMKRALERTKK